MIAEDNVFTYSSSKFIDNHIELLSDDGTDHLIDEWSKLTDKEFAYNLANYIFSGAINMWWEQTGRGDITVRPALVLTQTIQ